MIYSNKYQSVDFPNLSFISFANHSSKEFKIWNHIYWSIHSFPYISTSQNIRYPALFLSSFTYLPYTGSVRVRLTTWPFDAGPVKLPKEIGDFPYMLTVNSTSLKCCPGIKKNNVNKRYYYIVCVFLRQPLAEHCHVTRNCQTIFTGNERFR